MRLGVLFFVLLLAGCTASVNEPVISSPDIVIESFSFVPESLNVSVGGSVTWLNSDGAVHTIVADDGSFSSGVLNDGDSYSFTFNSPGTVSYHCSVHPSMRGVIVVD